MYRDSFINKRVDNAGFLVGQHFRNLYFRIKNELIQHLNTAYTKEDPNQDGHYWQFDIGSGQIRFWNM